MSSNCARGACVTFFCFPFLAATRFTAQHRSQPLAAGTRARPPPAAYRRTHADAHSTREKRTTTKKNRARESERNFGERKHYNKSCGALPCVSVYCRGVPLKIGVHTQGTFLAPTTFHPFSLTSFSGPFLGMRGKRSSGRCCRTRVCQRRSFLAEPKNAFPIASVCSREQYRSRRRECGNGIPCRRVRDVRPSCMHAATDLEQCGAARSAPAQDGELSRHRATTRSKKRVPSFLPFDRGSSDKNARAKSGTARGAHATIGRKNSQILPERFADMPASPHMCPQHQCNRRASAAFTSRRRLRDRARRPRLPKGDGITRAKQAAYFL